MLQTCQCSQTFTGGSSGYITCLGHFLGDTLLLTKFMARTDFWALMTEENIQYRVLVALLYHHMDRGLEHCKEEPSRELALAAAGLYLAFVSLPGRKIAGNIHSNDSVSKSYLLQARAHSRYFTRSSTIKRWTCSAWCPS